MPTISEAERRHAAHYAAMAQQAYDAYVANPAFSKRSMPLFDAEWQNIRRGWAWAEQRYRTDETAAEFPFAPLGVILGRQNRNRDALTALNSAVEQKPADAWVLAQRAMVHLQLLDYDNALADIQRASELEPTAAWILSFRAAIYEQMGRYHDALDVLTRAFEMGLPEDAWVLTHRAIIRHVLGQHSQALLDYDKAVELAPDAAWVVTHRGIALRGLHRYREALADHERAAALDPSNPWVLEHLAITLSEAQSYLGALTVFDEALKADPSNASLRSERARTLRHLGLYKEALAEHAAAISLADTPSSFAFGLRAETYRSQGCYEQALADLNQAVSLDPDGAWILADRGDTLRLLGRREDALVDLDRAVSLWQEAGWIRVNRAVAYREIGHYDRALADHKISIELNPDDDRYYYEQALTLMAAGQIVQAHEDLAFALRTAHEKVQQEPQDWLKVLELAQYELAAGHFEDAFARYERALAASILPHHIHKALRDLRDFVAVFPQHAGAQSIRQLLQFALKDQDQHSGGA